MIRLSSYLLLCLIIACSSEDEPVTPTPSELPSLTVSDISVIESEAGAMLRFEIKASRSDFVEPITFNYATEGLSAEPGVDFESTSGSGTINVGSTETLVEVTVLDDDILEVEETLQIVLTNLSNATVGRTAAIGTITDGNDQASRDESGTLSPASYYGYETFWSDEFSAESINTEFYNFRIGDGCPDLCRWGNEELQEYSDDQAHARLENGNLIITADRAESGFNSARINTKDKVEFRFGRIDIRAKLPEGQGIWPAFWMLGANIDQVGWPACGEIDIMEIVGDKPNEVLGTAHWGEPGQGSTFQTGKITSSTDLSEEYHIYSIIWEINEIHWFIDNKRFHTIRSTEIGNAQWRFNQDFYLIFNIAVGGLLPGNPDDTTVFPQTMEIDYVRVFQPTF